jgi:hypothetical protein
MQPQTALVVCCCYGALYASYLFVVAETQGVFVYPFITHLRSWYLRFAFALGVTTLACSCMMLLQYVKHDIVRDRFVVL